MYVVHGTADKDLWDKKLNVGNALEQVCLLFVTSISSTASYKDQLISLINKFRGVATKSFDL